MTDSAENSKGARTVVGVESASAKQPASVSTTSIIINASALLVSLFIAVLDLTILSTAIPEITHEFQSLNDVGWYSSAFFLTMSVFQTVWGKIYKQFDLKYSFIVALLVFEFGTLGCALSVNSSGFIAARAIAGMGGAGILGGVYTITAYMVPPSKVPLFFGINGIIFTIASLAGPLIGGAFTSFVTWRWCFYVNLPMGGAVIGVILLFLRLPESSKPKALSAYQFLKEIDLPGCILITGALICILEALENAGVTKRWNSSQTIGLLVGWIVLTTAFVGCEIIQGDRGIVPPRYINSRGIGLCALFIFFLNFGIYSRMYFLPIYFQSVEEFSASYSGVLLLANILPNSFATIVAGGVLSKVGYYQPFLLTGAAIACIGSGLLYTLTLDWSLGKAIGYQVLVGIGDGLAVQIPVTAVQSFAPKAEAATVTGTILFFQLSSGVIGLATCNAIFSNRVVVTVAQLVPGANALGVIQTGATALNQVYHDMELIAIESAFLAGLRDVWILIIVTCATAFVAAMAVPMVRVAIRDDQGNVDHEKVEAAAKDHTASSEIKLAPEKNSDATSGRDIV